MVGSAALMATTSCREATGAASPSAAMNRPRLSRKA